MHPMYLIKLYAVAIVLNMTVDLLKPLNHFASSRWFFDGGFTALMVIICVLVTYADYKEISLDELGD